MLAFPISKGGLCPEKCVTAIAEWRKYVHDWSTSSRLSGVIDLRSVIQSSLCSTKIIVMRRKADSGDGKMPIDRVRRRISSFKRSMGLFEAIFR